MLLVKFLWSSLQSYCLCYCFVQSSVHNSFQHHSSCTLQGAVSVLLLLILAHQFVSLKIKLLKLPLGLWPGPRPPEPTARSDN
jgi:hypothetical protein